MDQFLSSITTEWFGDNVWLFLLVMTALAIILFLMRKYVRWLYGVIEVLAGLMLLYLSFKVLPGAFSKDFSADFDIGSTTVTFTAILGGVFAIIRGFDSLDTWWQARDKAKALKTV